MRKIRQNSTSIYMVNSTKFVLLYPVWQHKLNDHHFKSEIKLYLAYGGLYFRVVHSQGTT